ncbi:rhomboid family intramembrane serine protease [Aureibacter tunicatorum]|uniref:Membrane associated rhomboid family serine protease n=1 Tax=Aureibacter tunicatorum TaxID=866807 RepID=A0AAE4BTR0_9BACT|nr:rhomboid family intramembrane serine protease [Aureibacter tunicatorum]MDR6239907.1 membrane associated rhomboid family serine protease [Aureibacter tunicatorum]BDD04382.1 rhomboid family intramembrane serine protease [Aureibacter tunicatorum]
MEHISTHESKLFYRSLLMTTLFIGILWTITVLEWFMHEDFGFLGILPRKIEGAVGIITGPLIHGSFSHLLSNTFPLLILGIGLFYFYHKIAIQVFVSIYVASGFWVWLSAREAYHIGSSGIVYGLVSFLFFIGLLRRDQKSMAVSLCVFLLYGGMMYGLMPSNGEVSWESHLFGTLTGLFCALYFQNYSEESKPSLRPVESRGVDYTRSRLEYPKRHVMRISSHTHGKQVRFKYKVKKSENNNNPRKR